MDIVFMGTPAFAVPSLRALADRHRVVAAYTRPDSASGRGSRLRPSDVKAAAIELGIPVEQPATLRDEVVIERLRSYRPDLIVVAAYGMLLPDEVLGIAPLGAINVHGSLLPRWRGAAPIERAILAGDERIGVTIMRIVSELDAGDFCASVSVEAGGANAEELRQTLADLGAAALLQTVEAIERDTVEWTVQDPDQVTYAPKIDKHEVALSPELTVEESLRRVRASSKHAPARFSLAGHGVRAVTARGADGGEAVGAGRFRVVREGVSLGVMDGALVVTGLKPDGKGVMPAADWMRGLRLTEGDWSAERWD